MRFLFASDSFKGSLSSEKTAELLEQSAEKYFPGCTCIKVPVADGGEGTADVVIKAAGGKKVFVQVHDPYMNPIEAYYGVVNEKNSDFRYECCVRIAFDSKRKAGSRAYNFLWNGRTDQSCIG